MCLVFCVCSKNFGGLSIVNYLDSKTSFFSPPPLFNSNALCFGSDGWNFKNDEQAMASWTMPSCHIKAAKTARKLSAKHDGKARFGNVAVLFVISFISHEDILGKLSLANAFLVSFSLSTGLEKILSVGVTGR